MTIPKIKEIREQILADIEAADTTTPLLPRAVWRTLASALSGALYLVYRYGDWISKQIFTATAEGSSLDDRGVEYGVARKFATRWEGSGAASGNGIIPRGALLSAGSRTYEVTSATSATAAIPIHSLEHGKKQNAEVNETLRLKTPIVGVGRDITVKSITTEAVDRETDAEFRARLLARQRNQPTGGSFADFIMWAKQVPGITNARVARTAPGEVVVYPVTAEGVPSAAKLAEVERYINSEHRYPFGRHCKVEPPAIVYFDVTYSNLSPRTQAIREALKAATTAYFLRRYPDQYEDELKPTKNITATEISGEALNAGLQNVVVRLDVVGGANVTLEGYTLSRSQIARVRNITFPQA